MEKLRIGVVFGGRSAEHQVSLVSAQSVIQALDKNKYDIVPIGITTSGQWIAGDDALSLLKSGQDQDHPVTFLPADPTSKQLIAFDKNTIQNTSLDLIFPVLHGTFGEDGTIQGLFELAGMPYVGAGVLGSSVSMDKIIQKLVCLQAGLPAANFVWFRGIDWTDPATDSPVLDHQLANMTRNEMLTTIETQLDFPVFVKPPNLGSSIGISKAHDRTELEAGIEQALRYDRKVLVEQAVPHAREIEVSVLGNERPRASVTGEVIPSNEFYDYDAKYVDDASDLKIPADLPKSVSDAIRDSAIKSVLAVEAEGLSRVDYLVNSQSHEFYLNEINTIPGFTKISMYPKLWQATGLEYSDLLDQLIQLALDRHQKRNSLFTSYQPKSDWYK